MYPNDSLAEQFEANRSHLRAVAYRMLGSAAEADDAVQETWLRLNRSDAATVEKLGGWLTTVTARVCLDMLRSRSSRREDSLDADVQEQSPKLEIASTTPDPEREALLADSVGLALLVVLDRLTPAERLAFVLHDMFAIPFEEIADIIGRTPEATRQLASRARRRVQGAESDPTKLNRQHQVVEAFLAALRAGDFEGVVAALDPNVVVRIDEFAGARPGAAHEIRGAENWAKGAIAFSKTLREANPAIALIDGTVGIILAPRGHLQRALRFTFENDKIVRADIIGDPARLQEMELGVVGK